MAFEIPEIVYAFGPQLKFMEVGILLTYFAVSCSSLSEDSAEFRYVPLYIADQVEFHCYFCKNFTLLQLTNRFHVAVRLFSNRSQMTSKCGKNKKVAHEA